MKFPKITDVSPLAFPLAISQPISPKITDVSPLAPISLKLRDLAQSGEMTDNLRTHCIRAYRTFAAMYADIETTRISQTPERCYGTLQKRLVLFTLPDPRDPAKLARVKTQVRERAANYLTCLFSPGVAPDNNAAERSLRHLVLKRKISFGSFSEKTADNLAVLLSVLLSWKRRGTLREYLLGV